jgi:hypothetical protein
MYDGVVELFDRAFSISIIKLFNEKGVRKKKKEEESQRARPKNVLGVCRQ